MIRPGMDETVISRLSVLVAYLAGLIALLPTLAAAALAAAVAWVGLRFIVQLAQILIS